MRAHSSRWFYGTEQSNARIVYLKTLVSRLGLHLLVALVTHFEISQILLHDNLQMLRSAAQQSKL